MTASMLHSVFFNEGYVVYATNQLICLKYSALYSCVRIHTDNTVDCYERIKAFGSSNTNIQIVK